MLRIHGSTNACATANKEKVKVASLMDCERYRGPKVAHKCLVCGGNHSYIRSNGATGQWTRLIDCTDGYQKFTILRRQE